MAEFLSRGWNVAMPEVDVGDDIFVVRDLEGDFWRVQVKTANAVENRRGYAASFSISLPQLRTPSQPDVTYVFVVRRREEWSDFVVIDRAALNTEHRLHQLGSQSGEKLTVWMSFRNGTIISKKRDLTSYRSNWSKFPVISH